MKLSRNDICWCGSNIKYKNCHLVLDEKIQKYCDKGALIPNHSLIKTASQIEGIKKAGTLNTAILDMVASHLKEGMSTEEVNTMVHEYTVSHNAIPATLNFNGFPKSVCTSLNNEVCHGIPSKDTILKNGDIVNIDVTTILDGYFADASRMFLIGDISKERQRLVTVAKECLDFGLAAAKPWGYLGDIGAAIYNHAKNNNYSIVREIGGHGVGLEFHEEPWVSHIGTPNTGMLLVPGMIFTIEPMVNAGTPEVYEDTIDGWTIRTKDGKDSAQWEYTVLITEDDAIILTH